MLVDFPVTQAVRFLREKKVEFVPRLYDYVEKGGTAESAKQLGVDEHAVIKTTTSAGMKRCMEPPSAPVVPP